MATVECAPIEDTPLAPPITTRSRKRRPFLFVACWGYLLAVIATCVFLRVQGDRSWLGTFVLMAPRWPFALPLVLLLPWAMLARRWVMMSLVFTAMAIVACPLMGFRLAIPAAETQRGDLRLLTFNVHRQHVDVAGFAQVIEESQPDVIAIQDWSSALQKKLFPDDDWHTRQVGELFIASRFPIGEVTPIDFNDSEGVPKAERGAAAVFELKTPKGTICLINLHLASPHSALNSLSDDGGTELNRNALRRWAESETVRSMADRINQPLVLTGDFNTTDDSPIFREHWQGFADAFTERGFGFGYTYLNTHTQFRIDHVLSDASWKPIRATIGPEAGSPHRPLIVDLQRQ
jgi:endonuclease/exonuclease/phosphatase (EEP) superfamily protein YafD